MIVETKKGKLPVRYGMNALAHFGDITGKSMRQVMEDLQGPFYDLPTSEILAFIYAGFVCGADWKKQECKVESVKEVGNMIDDDAELIVKMFDAYNEGEEVKEGEESKKK